MGLSIVKETIELESLTTDLAGNAWVTKRINLDAGKMHRLVQVDSFEDAYPNDTTEIEIVISPYPAIPTNMDYQPLNSLSNRYPAGGDDSVLFKERRQSFPTSQVSNTRQFPSAEISALNTFTFYTDHVYLNMHFMADPNTTLTNIAYSFLLVLQDKSVNNLVHSLGVMSEQHDAMCALVMSNGAMRSRDALLGNVFPMWRFGGIRPEHTITPLASNSFFLEIASRDAEQMQNTTQIRQSVADARQMSAFDSAFGERRPDWLREFLNAGYESGPIRPNPVPLKYADNGNTRMF